LFTAANSFSGNIEPSERAITLKLDDDALVDHEIYPGDSVDVLVTSTSKDSHKYTKTVGQDLRVLLCVTKEASESRTLTTSFNKITLAATPSQAELLAEAQETGKIKLTLRNKLARVPQSLAGVGEDDLLPASAKGPQVAKAPASLASLPPYANAAALAPPPPPMAQVAAPPEQPLQWIVEMFSGSQRDQYAVPLSPQ
jgi:pilus assembly protein CpaB